VIEGTMSNLFAIRDGRLLTPDLGACGLPGTMRQLIMTLAREAGLSCETRTIKPAELAHMEELFICNSIIAVMPVSRLAETRYPLEQGLQWRHRVLSHLEKASA
jgi:branched-subunit amino acid aminotransferase/4-amino-4-deoxychorismate lyase